MDVKYGEPLRYERKFLITDYKHQDIEQLIKFHPACFSEIFHLRTVNNIYFDSFGMNHYYDNIEGSADRVKVRIRWYGALKGNIQQPVLEYKIKKGLLGKKNSYLLNPFTLDERFDKAQIEKALQRNEIPLAIKNEMRSLTPKLLNNYERRYYLSQDKKFRITIDFNLTYHAINYGSSTFLKTSKDYQSTVLELKYDSQFEPEAKAIANEFPFMLTKNSKYLQGLERLIL
ncbi:MAG TPA: VTC domain-containing protein [Bacteroidia bacterium]|jgi:SPX domain protein involved in polyphosphate accumulation|nr:VTC domain-containing protein [Bacteroidia bacterium]